MRAEQREGVLCVDETSAGVSPSGVRDGTGATYDRVADLSRAMGSAGPKASINSAQMPATCGVAIDVPRIRAHRAR